MEDQATGTWAVIASSLAGTKHLKSESPCQDAHCWRVHHSGVLIAAVADGAGSQKYSQFGASIAVHEIVEHISNVLDDSAVLDRNAMLEVFKHVRSSISNEASRLSVEPRQLACTLCALVVFDSFCIQANIGDSAAILKMRSGKVVALIAPYKGEYANETAFVTDNNWEANLEIVRQQGEVASAMIATDGLMDWSLRGTIITSSFVLPILEFASTDGDNDVRHQQLNSFLRSATITSRVDDDVTIVLCHRKLSEPNGVDSEIPIDSDLQHPSKPPGCYTTGSGNPVQLGRQLGKGGEGVVFEALSHPGLVAKVYQPRPDQKASPQSFAAFLMQSHDKLRAMIAASPTAPDPDRISIAWPKHTLHYSGTYVGFLMPLINLAVSDKIYNFCHPRVRRNWHPSFTRKNAFQAARNLASVVEVLHASGHVVGDMNHANILCQENGYVTLIDTDSFAITDPSGKYFPCTCAMPEYLAPELQGSSALSLVEWRSTHDCFALAIHVFQLLLNQHPFDGILRDGAITSKPVNIHLIEKRVFPYAQNCFADPPQKGGTRFGRLSPAMQQAFIKTFQDGADKPEFRLRCTDWIDLLAQEEKALTQCLVCKDWNEAGSVDCLNCGVEIPAVATLLRHTED